MKEDMNSSNVIAEFAIANTSKPIILLKMVLWCIACLIMVYSAVALWETTPVGDHTLANELQVSSVADLLRLPITILSGCMAIYMAGGFFSNWKKLRAYNYFKNQLDR